MSADKVYRLQFVRIQSLEAMGLVECTWVWPGFVFGLGICCVQMAANLVACVFARSVTLTLLTTAAFTPQSKAELQEAIDQC